MEVRDSRLLMPELLDAFNRELTPEEEPLSERTVRYYVAEGLLPKPARPGKRALYSQGHLDRLRLIKRLKDREFLPLSQVKESARATRRRAGQGGAGAIGGPPERARAKQLVERLLSQTGQRPSGLTAPPRAPIPAAAPRSPAAAAAPRAEQWRHIELADGLLLLVRQPAPRETEELVREIVATSRST